MDGVKIGMLNDVDSMLIVAQKLREYKPENIIIDPVMIAKGGHALMQQDALETLIKEMIPCAYVLTPNIPEAQAIVGFDIETIEDMKKAAIEIHKLGAKNVLVKGGHLIGDAIDILYSND